VIPNTKLGLSQEKIGYNLALYRYKRTSIAELQLNVGSFIYLESFDLGFFGGESSSKFPPSDDFRFLFDPTDSTPYSKQQRLVLETEVTEPKEGCCAEV